MITCTTCAGLTFNLEPCRCGDGGNRLLVEWGDDAREAYRDCRLCGGSGTVAQGCVDCGQRGRRRAQLVLTVANLDTGQVASRSVVPGSVPPTRATAGGWCLALTPLVRQLTAAVGAAGLIDRRRPWEAGELTVPLNRRWRPDLPAERRYVLEAEAIARHQHRPWRVLLGRSVTPPVVRPAQALSRLCGLADLLCLDLVIEARRQPWGDPTWHVRFEVPGGEVPAESPGWASDLRAAVACTTVTDALTGLGERGLTAPAYAIVRTPGARPAPVVDLDRVGRRMATDLRRAPAAQAIWRDGRWWHTRLVPGGSTIVLHERDTGQVVRHRRTVLLRAGEPPQPSWQGPPIGHTTCADCAPGSRLSRCDCTLGGGPADPACAHCCGAGFAPSVFVCARCRGSRRLHSALTVTVTDLRSQARHELWRPGEAPPVAPLPGCESVHRLPRRHRLTDRAASFGVRPCDLTDADGGTPLPHLVREGLVVLDRPVTDPTAVFLAGLAAGRPGARLIVAATAPDVPPLADLVRLAVGLDLSLAVVVCRHRPEPDDPLSPRGLTWGVELLPLGTPADRLDPPVRDSVEAAVAHCLTYLDNTVLAAVPADPATPIPVPQRPTAVEVADPVPLLTRLAAHHAGRSVTITFSQAGCAVRLTGQEGGPLLARAATLADAVRALGSRPA
ncbi:hypothetical protein V6U77_14780 [Micromonospora sp. CPCC 205546]|uniref:hypothetical protein n=1 Tax=Micromonospora sp. CPCC 205546 TaxID=3122397 RepID=UPI002FF09498